MCSRLRSPCPSSSPLQTTRLRLKNFEFHGTISLVDRDLPTLDELGRDLLQVSRLPVYLSLIFPFALTVGFFSFNLVGWSVMALLCPVLLSFFTYASISLRPRLPGVPFSSLRQVSRRRRLGRRRCQHDSSPSHAGWNYSAVSYWRHALTNKADRLWIRGEGAAIVILIGLSLLVIPWTILPVIYCGLVIAGSWVYPFMTSWVPHDASGASELTQTRLFRGQVVRHLALEHLYHLEHHLYPQVPHHRWPDLARRLDPHFKQLGLTPIILWF